METVEASAAAATTTTTTNNNNTKTTTATVTPTTTTTTMTTTTKSATAAATAATTTTQQHQQQQQQLQRRRRRKQQSKTKPKVGVFLSSYFVTLKTLSSLRARRADSPKLPARSWKLTQNTSKTDPVMTIVSKRLNELKIGCMHEL
jgi:hypothetical protein